MCVGHECLPDDISLAMARAYANVPACEQRAFEDAITAPAPPPLSVCLPAKLSLVVVVVGPRVCYLCVHVRTVEPSS